MKNIFLENPQFFSNWWEGLPSSMAFCTLGPIWSRNARLARWGRSTPFPHAYTGRIGSRQQLAENAWLVSLGCSGGAQRPCRVPLHIIQLGFEGKPLFWKIGRFSLYACGNGVDLPHLAKRAFHDQIGPNVQKAMLLGSPSHHGTKNCGLLKNIDSFFFFAFHGSKSGVLSQKNGGFECFGPGVR